MKNEKSENDEAAVSVRLLGVLWMIEMVVVTQDETIIAKKFTLVAMTDVTTTEDATTVTLVIIVMTVGTMVQDIIIAGTSVPPKEVKAAIPVGPIEIGETQREIA
jgi:hypothetical protein